MFLSPWIRKPDFPKNGRFNYGSYWKKRGWRVRNSLRPREVMILSEIPEGSRVIDIGCGNSRLPVALKEKGIDIEVADVSKEVLCGYESFGIVGREIDLEKISDVVITKPYDYIIMSEVLEHTTNPEEIILKLAKYTKYFIFTIPNSAAYMFRYGLLIRGRFFTQWVMHPSEHLRFWSHIDFLDWLVAMGLRLEKTKVTDGFTFRGIIPWLPDLWRNFLGFRMMYVCSTKNE